VGQSTEIKFHLIHVAPAPILSRLEGPDNGVTYGVKVLCRMFVLRRVAASDVAAYHAKAQVHPDIAHLQAFFASPCVRFDILDLVDM
jgi:hypothetical protein